MGDPTERFGKISAHAEDLYHLIYYQLIVIKTMKHHFGLLVRRGNLWLSFM